jgi:hypothetical protein
MDVVHTAWTKNIEPTPLARKGAQDAVQDTIRCGLLSAFPGDWKGPPKRLVTTAAFQDLMLFVLGEKSFDDMLITARNDKRFNDLFDRIDAGML